MAVKKPRIIVIGAGVLGSSITHNLAIRGANVLLVDQGQKPGSGVTGRAFGRVNVINGDPGQPNYTLWRQAVAEYRKLSLDFPEALASARPGSLLWKATSIETEQFADLHRRAGEDIELLDGSEVAKREPRLRQLPECVVFSPNCLALDPSQLAASFVTAAVAAGAVVKFGEKIVGIESANGQATGVRVSAETLNADIVVVTAGGGTSGLVETLGVDIAMTTSPALLLRYACNVPVINHILRGPRLEVRQASDNTLFVAKSYTTNGGYDGPEAIGERSWQ